MIMSQDNRIIIWTWPTLIFASFLARPATGVKNFLGDDNRVFDNQYDADDCKHDADDDNQGDDDKQVNDKHDDEEDNQDDETVISAIWLRLKEIGTHLQSLLRPGLQMSQISPKARSRTLDFVQTHSIQFHCIRCLLKAL